MAKGRDKDNGVWTFIGLVKSVLRPWRTEMDIFINTDSICDQMWPWCVSVELSMKMNVCLY